MEILKVGTEFSIDGYKSITLTDNKSENISSFAQVNNISESEAEQILKNNQSIQDFMSSINSKDDDEAIVLTGDLNESLKSLEQTNTSTTPQNTTPNANTTESVATENTTSQATNSQDVLPDSTKRHELNGVTFSVDTSQVGSRFTYDFDEQTQTLSFSGAKCAINIEKVSNPDIKVQMSGISVTLNSTAKVKSIHDTGMNSVINGSDEDDNITSSGINATINAGNGNDTINATGINTTINGGDGNDKISASGIKTNIFGGNGDDIITTSGINIFADGGAGNDTISGDGINLTLGGGSSSVESTGNVNNISANGINIKANGGKNTNEKNIISFSGINVSVDKTTQSNDDIVTINNVEQLPDSETIDNKQDNTDNASGIVNTVSTTFAQQIENYTLDDIEQAYTQLKQAKLDAMKSEDTVQLANIENQQQQLHTKAKELEIKKAKQLAESNAKTLSEEEQTLLENKLDAEYKLRLLEEKQSYFDYKKTEIDTALKEAVEQKDETAQTTLTQQQASILSSTAELATEINTNTELLNSIKSQLENIKS